MQTVSISANIRNANIGIDISETYSLSGIPTLSDHMNQGVYKQSNRGE